MRTVAGILGLVLAVAARPAAAQTTTMSAARPAAQAASRPAPTARHLGVRAYVLFDVESMAASQTFKAVVNSSRLHGAGLGGEILNVWRQAFVRVAFARMSRSGSRAFVDNGQVFSLGIPLTVKLTPVEVAGGWRFAPEAGGRYVLYGGAGALLLGYSETSDLAQTGDNVSQTFHGYVAFGGVDVPVGRWITAGAEVQYRGLPGAIGDAGVSKAYGETNLGGFVVRVLVGVKR
jgi:hypothetical protein